MTPDDQIEHGTTRGYDQHQKHDVPYCQPCRDAVARYENERRLERLHGITRTRPGVGTARRMQGLVALGYTYRALGEMLGVSHDQARKLAIGEHPVVLSSTAAAVDNLYRRMSMTPAPDTSRAKYARTVAARYGWVTPLAWNTIDDPDEQPTGGYRPYNDRIYNHETGHLDAPPPEDVDPIAVQRILDGDWRLACSKADKQAVVARWTGTYGQLERLTGWKVDRYVTRDPEAAA